MNRHITGTLLAGLLLSSLAVIASPREEVLYWNFDQSGLPLVKDQSGKNNHPKAVGKPVRAEGISGGAIRFNGSGEHLQVPVSPSLTFTDGMTVSLWLKPAEVVVKDPKTSGRDSQDIMSCNWNLRLRLDHRGHPEMVLITEGERADVVNYGIPSDNEWIHLVVTFDGKTGQSRLYQNGMMVNEKTFKPAMLRKESGLITLGANSDKGYGYNGLIDEFALYNYAMTPEEVQSIGIAPDQAQLAMMNREIQTLSTQLSTNRSDKTLLENLSKFGAELKNRIGQSAKAPRITAKEFSSLKNDFNFFQLAAKGLSANPVQFADIVPFRVNPISNIIRRSDAVPPDGQVTDQLAFRATPGEYEADSFILAAMNNRQEVTFTVSDLTGSAGTIPASMLDIRVVKNWYQADSAWRDILLLQREQRHKVPELLLYNDALIKVDDDTRDNYALLNGEYQLISKDGDIGKTLFISVEDFPIADAKTLCPVNLNALEFKQFWLTLHVPDDTPKGNYSGTITLQNSDGQLGEFQVSLEVLPFTLPAPRTAYDPARPFTPSIYYKSNINPDPGPGIDFRYRSKEQVAKELTNLKEHNITAPMVYHLQWGNQENFHTFLQLYKDLGLDMSALYLLGKESNQNFGWNNSKENVEAYKKLAAELKKTAEEYGFKEVYLYGVDEAHEVEMYEKELDFFKAAHDVGAKVFVSSAGLNKPAHYIDGFIYLAGILDLAVGSGASNQLESARWHKAGGKLWSYGDPQAGAEDPLLYRRNFGLKLWRKNYDGVATYLYYGGFGNPWNDFDNIPYRDHNFVYPTVDGVVDTIAWEGVREAIDDIRYATKLSSLIVSAPAAKQQIAQKAKNYLTQIDLESTDPAQVRTQIIDYILQLQ